MSDRLVLFTCLFCFVLPLWSGCSLMPKRQEPDSFWEQYLPADETSIPLDSFTETNRDLDVAIIGEGFFQVSDLLTGECYYSRHGHFNINSNGELVTGSFPIARPLEPSIVIPEDTVRIQIHDDGTVWIIRKGKKQQRQEVGQIILATFNNPEGLDRVDENLYRATETSGTATLHVPGIEGMGVLKSQYLEVLE